MEIIAEIGQNHNGDMDLALKMIRQAKASGADVVKFQIYDARALFPQEGNEWFEYNCQTELSRDQVEMLAEACNEVGIEFLASVFDVERVGWTEKVGVKRYKIASRSIHDSELVQAIAHTRKPIIASLGMWDSTDFPVIQTSSPVYYLYCVSKYPTELSELNLNSVDFQKYSGFSDHSIGITAALVAFSRGARMVEKHFTLDRSLYGPDHVCSMTPEELVRLSRLRDEISQCL
jgi:sialic acid synthase SpsE